MGRTSAAGEGRDATEGEPAPPPPFVELLTACRVSAVHLEMRDSYTPQDPDFLRWRDGDHFDPVREYRAWIELVSPLVAHGVVVRRARIVSEPVTDYIAFEHGVTPMNLAAGEQVRWLPRRRASDLALPGNDFWVFDDRLVRFGYFSGVGDVLGHEVVEDPAVVKLCASAFEAVWERAVPHEEYTIR